MDIVNELRKLADQIEYGKSVNTSVTIEDIYTEIIARLSTVRDGWQHKSKWNQELGSSFLDLYIDDYKKKVSEL